jgi:hypothetical protein
VNLVGYLQQPLDLVALDLLNTFDLNVFDLNNSGL